MSVEFRWLGVAGIELTEGEETLAIDPFFSRPPFRRMWLGRVFPDHRLVAAKLPRCDFVLVTHAHWDHLMDVPEVVRNTGASALASRNSCRLLGLLGVPKEQVHEIRAGDDLDLGNFQIQVFWAQNGTARQKPIKAGLLPSNLRPSLGIRDYRMDVSFSFLVEVDGYRLLDWGSENPDLAVPADLLFVEPDASPAYYDLLLNQVKPRLVVPIHWEDPFRPLSRPLLPMLSRPVWALPPPQRANLVRFQQTLRRVAPTSKLLLPEVFRRYDLRQLL